MQRKTVQHIGWVVLLSLLFLSVGMLRPSRADDVVLPQDFVIEDGVLTEYHGIAETVVIPDGVKVIGRDVFKGCFWIRTLVLPNSVEEIEDNAFAYCTRLVEVTLPLSAKYYEFSFYGAKIETLTYTQGTGVYAGHPGTSNGGTKLIRPSGLTKLVFAEGVEAIPAGVAKNCTALRTVVIPSSCQYIGDHAFFGCTDLGGVIPLTADGLVIDDSAFAATGNIEIDVLGKNVTIGRSAFASSQVARIGGMENVTLLEQAAFEDCQKLHGPLVIPEGMEEIADGAFAGSGFASVVLPDSVWKIGNGAFQNCSCLEEVTLPLSAIYEEYTFAGTHIRTVIYTAGNGTAFGHPSVRASYGEKRVVDGIQELVFAEGIKAIPDRIALDCYNVRMVVLPSTCQKIGKQAFYNCSSWNQVVVLPSRVAVIDDQAFEGAGIPAIEITGEAVSIGERAFANSKLLNVLGMEHIILLENEVFSGCSYLTGELVLPEGTKAIADGAFFHTGFEKVVLPDSVVLVGDKAFCDCSNLVEVVMPISAAYTSSSFYGDDIISVTFTKGNGVSVIPAASGSGSCISQGVDLKELIFSEGITDIPGYIAMGAPQLTFVSIPSTCQTIGERAFFHCTSLQETLVFPESLQEIGEYAFYRAGMKEIVIQGKGLRIGNYAFARSSLENIEGMENIKTISAYAFEDCVALAGDIVLPEGMTTIPYGMFAGSRIRSVVIPDSVETISDEAFRDCKNLRTIKIPQSASYSAKTFTGTGATTVIFTVGTGYMADNHFKSGAYVVNQASLKSLIFEEGVTIIPARIAKDCTNLQEVSIPQSCESIETLAFSGCSALSQDIVLPKKLTNVGEEAFGGAAIQSVTFLGNQVSIQARAFQNSNIKEIHGLENVRYIYNGAFQDCALLGGSLQFTENTKLIAWRAFYGTGITKVVIPKTIQELSYHVFADCINLQEVTLPFSTKYDGTTFAGTNIPHVTYTAGTGGYALHPSTSSSGTQTIMKYVTRLDFASDVTIVPPEIAKNCTTLEQVNFYGNVRMIGDQAFYGCTNLKGMFVIPNTLEIMGDLLLAKTSITDIIYFGTEETWRDKFRNVKVEFPAGSTLHYMIVTPRVEPTCLATGLTEGIQCKDCSLVWKTPEIIPISGHTKVVDPRVEPTCTKSGKMEGAHCSVCGKILTAQKVIAAVGHDYHGTVTTQPTYLLTGTRTMTCSRCQGTYTETIPRLALPFTDVPAGNWKENTVRYMLEYKLMSGKTATTFEPDTIMNRAQLVSILWSLEGKPQVIGTLNFTDVTSKNTFYKPILWASKNKIVNGYSTGEFKPKGELTREQIATILMNYAKYKGVSIGNKVELNSFKDVADINSKMVASLQWAVGNKIISGKSGGTLLDPKGLASRIEVAAMVMNYVKNIMK